MLTEATGNEKKERENYLYHPSDESWLTKISDDKCDDIACGDDDEDLSHDT
jgi:hypothetical protein